MKNEATARIRINKLLEEAGWRFFDDENGQANILLENKVQITQKIIDEWGEDYEKTSSGSLDFLLVDNSGKPICVLEAKKESIHPIAAKEQARKYAKTVEANYVILSNGIVHYLWDIRKGNPKPIFKFPSPDEIGAIKEWNPDRKSLAEEIVDEDFIVKVQMPDYAERPDWKGSITASKNFIWTNGLRFLRKYQLSAIQHLQKAVAQGKDRFLFEMATGTGKTLTSAAIIRLFLRTKNARRVLFLVDRLELEDQAWKAFVNYLKPDYSTFIYKEHKSDWQKADIVVTTIQSLMANDRYRYDFKPSDFDLLISDEAHRSISGNARAVFEYFHGYKLGLTATPRDYLKGVDSDKVKDNDPREIERRMLRDTYSTFGCEGGEPTYRYSLLDGVKDGFLVNPITLDARTEITTQLLSDEGYAVTLTTEEGEGTEVFVSRDFEKKFFSDKTNSIFCQTFLENALRDPITKEIGKTIIFGVSQNHARKITEMLNEFAEQFYPGKYNSDFAVQVTSQVGDAQQMTINFTNNNLNGKTTWLEAYKSSKTRVCVTVGMMTTGYDCPDLLNVCMMRPIFSPSDFVQIKGRGTRKNTFEYIYKNELNEEEIQREEKEAFKLFDFFANCEYFEEKFNYDEKLKLPKPRNGGEEGGGSGGIDIDKYTSYILDPILSLVEENIGPEGMRIDRELFKKFEDRIIMDDIIRKNVELGNWENVVSHIQQEIFDKPEQYFNLEKLRKAAKIDRKVSIREVVEKIFGIIPKFKSKDEMLEEEFDKFVSIYPPDEDVNVRALKYFFKAYIIDQDIRKIIEAKDFQALQTNPTLTISQFKEVAPKYREVVPMYIKDYVKLEQFAA
ncbi:MAG: DEAD/DEAH box helicase family protein [Cytophagales bacterium]|nr:DEAD/DEAH box helicase family protein [Cytophagales bacterium]MCA6389171.1 DEAD/DEAH box helicase family protein [Cytophagales bacterium]MCA6392882.1 DEAD/DEAH box helicase family protein [Cytophagales bacterium]MCA6395172.1 DEAD/DEAH box helicase family protein [Cytophagales bacterium]MCA6398702.1 DEAD/DEAH box helicase family protein [Cytophagales bacterium]